MPFAQGSTTIRRRPKDGVNGQDAVRYWLVPSVSQIKRTPDGNTIIPSVITCNKYKQTGNYTPIATSEGILKYQTCGMDGILSSESIYPTSGVTLPKSLSYIKFTLYLVDVAVASETVPVIVDGEDGYILDLDNEMAGVPCDYEGKVLASVYPSSNVRVYKGSNIDLGWDFSLECIGCTASLSKWNNNTDFKISVSNITADTATVLVTATKEGHANLYATMTIYKVIPGAPGEDAVVYSILPDVSTVSHFKDGTLSKTSVSCTKYKTIGATNKSTTTENTLKYIKYTNGVAGTETTCAAVGTATGKVTIDTSTTAVEFKLYKGTSTTLLDSERVPVITDGTDGVDSYRLDLDNEMAGIACNYNGTVTGSFPSCKATVYKAATADSGWSFSVDNTNCTATIDKNGNINITAISADEATILVTATKPGCADLTATMSLYKVKAGSPGTSPTIYSIEPNVSAVSQNAVGVVSPGTITVYKYSQTGSGSRVATTSHRIVAIPYNKSGVAQTQQTISTNGGSSSGTIQVLASYSAIDFIMYSGASGTTVLDRETVPIVQDGDDGDDSTSFWLILNTLVVRKSGTTMTPSSITCKAMKKEGKKDAEEVTDLTIKYKRTYTSGTVSTGTYSSAVSFTSTTQQLYFYLIDENGNELASETVIAVSDGEQGIPGNQGMQGCILRNTQWLKNFTYHNDIDLETDGERYLDFVYVEDSSADGGFERYKCTQTHTASDTNAPGTTLGQRYWSKINKFESPFYTPVLLADYASIKFAQTNQILIINDEKISGGFGGGDPALWLGAEEFKNAPFRVNRYGEAWMLNAHLEGDLKAGNPDGQHIHIDPENKEMVIYDSNKSAVAFFEGNSHTSLSSLTGGSSGTFTMNDSNKNKSYSVTGNNTATQQSSGTLKLSSYIQTDAAVEVVVSGSMYAYATPADTATDTGSNSGTTRPGLNDSQIQQPSMMAGGSATLSLYITTYTSSALTTVKSKTLITSIVGTSSGTKKTLTSVRQKTSGGGYHVLEMTWHVSASGSGKSASVSWGTNVSSGTTFSASYVSDFYVSRFFANGFCLAKSAQNYIWAYNQGTNGMRFVMENNGYGIDVSNAGIKLKHHSGNWFNMPMFMFHGFYEFSSSNNTYTLKNQRSFDGNYPQITRSAEGYVRITFPSSWLSALSINSLSDIEISLTGLGYSSGSSSAPLKATVASFTPSSGYLYINLSDDASRNDGSFLIDLKYLGS